MHPTPAAPGRRTGDVAASRDVGWYPIAFLIDLPRERPTRVEVLGRGYVLFADAAGVWRALVDECPHRLARLSDGQVRGGLIRCGYHGWSFAGDGSCQHIPQLLAQHAVPAAACVAAIPVVVRQGLLWLGIGVTAEQPPELPTVAALEQPSCRVIDFAIDLPYGHDFLIENVLDYAHIHVAHDGVRGGGHAGLAGPIAFEVQPLTPHGFAARLGRSEQGRIAVVPGQPPAHVAFVAPGLVHYWSDYAAVGQPERFRGLAMYALPLAAGRCRLLYRAYGNDWSWRDRWRPRFWEHGHQCRLLEQDMAVVQGQAAAIAATSEVLAQRWLPLGSSDALVLAYRRWLDQYDRDRADCVGLRQRGAASLQRLVPASADRFRMHVLQCASCRGAMRAARLVRTAGLAVAMLLVVVAAASSRSQVVFAAAAVVAAGCGLAADLLLRRLAGPRASLLRDLCAEA